jgi:hypothetical protein
MTLSLLLNIALFVALGAEPFHGPQTAARLEFEPATIDVVRDSTGYVQQMIRFYSSTGDTVRVTSVNGSCRCANGSVQRPITHDSTAGKIYLAINAQHFTDSVNYVDFTVGHTGVNSPAMFRVVVRLQP